MAGICPLESESSEPHVTLAHGEGGRTMRTWIGEQILPRFGNAELLRLHDAAAVATGGHDILFTTDSYVVSPRHFPGGDIGSLAVYGTANDLAVCGACPLAISLALIIEEGLPLAELHAILDSIREAARSADVQVVTGDTKVVPRGAVDGLFINTAGIGRSQWVVAGPESLVPGDKLIVTGPIARHGFAVLCARDALDFDPPPQSDSAPLWPAVAGLRSWSSEIRAMRDATRGGVAAVLHEWADASQLSLVLDSSRLPVDPVVRGVSELLGLQPVHVACEGTMLVAVAPNAVDQVLGALRGIAVSREACCIGEVVERLSAPVVQLSPLGQRVPLDEPSGAPLPRIC